MNPLEDQFVAAMIHAAISDGPVLGRQLEDGTVEIMDSKSKIIKQQKWEIRDSLSRQFDYEVVCGEKVICGFDSHEHGFEKLVEEHNKFIDSI